MIDADE